MHIPVLQKEVLNFLEPKPNENFIDCTINGGGHTIALLEKIQPNGKILGIDWDEEQIKKLKLKIKNLEKRIILVCGNFVDLRRIAGEQKFEKVDGILFDLGMSSWHLEESGRGFSFQKDEPLNMRYNAKSSNGLTAGEIINKYSEEEIVRILKEYGEERFAKKIAKKIVEQRKISPIESTFQLLKIIRMAVPSWYCHKKLHFATRTFQALRIAVNSELENLRKALPQAFDILEPNGRLVVISFHSLEDRAVKSFFREKKNDRLAMILTKKPVRPTIEELKLNPRARSARLRAISKIGKSRSE